MHLKELITSIIAVEKEEIYKEGGVIKKATLEIRWV